MKRLGKVILTIALLFILVGCRSTDEERYAFVLERYSGAKIIQKQGSSHYVICYDGIMALLHISDLFGHLSMDGVMILNPEIVHCELKQGEKK